MEESILISRFAVTAPCLVDYGMHIGTRIRKARVEAGLEQAELAERIGVSPNTVWKWEAQQAAPRSALVEKLAAALGKPVGWIYGEGTSEVTIAGVAVSGPAEKLAAIVAALNAGDAAQTEAANLQGTGEHSGAFFVAQKSQKKCLTI